MITASDSSRVSLFRGIFGGSIDHHYHHHHHNNNDNNDNDNDNNRPPSSRRASTGFLHNLRSGKKQPQPPTSRRASTGAILSSSLLMPPENNSKRSPQQVTPTHTKKHQDQPNRRRSDSPSASVTLYLKQQQKDEHRRGRRSSDHGVFLAASTSDMVDQLEPQTIISLLEECGRCSATATNDLASSVSSLQGLELLQQLKGTTTDGSIGGSHSDNNIGMTICSYPLVVVKRKIDRLQLLPQTRKHNSLRVVVDDLESALEGILEDYE